MTFEIEKGFLIWFCSVICNGNRTKRSPIRCVITGVINKIGRAREGSPMLLTTSMILSVYHNQYIFREQINMTINMKRNSRE